MFKTENIWLLTQWSFSFYIMVRENWDGTALQWSAFAVSSFALIVTGIDAWLGKHSK
jgi:hypothetical protein